MTILHVVGARPNFMKASPVMSALSRRDGVVQHLVHTGQHYDKNMSDVFFSQLGLPQPDVNFEVGSGSHSCQTAQIMMRLEEYLANAKPDAVLVYGDVNSTLAAALVCAKMRMRFVHVEAGLRSFDRAMPEEINRVVTDHLADLLFTPSPDADENLLREGIDPARIRLVGNVMIDTLMRLRPMAEEAWRELGERLGLARGGYGLVTLHRASNVDDQENLRSFLEVIGRIGSRIPIVFPVHPRTRQRLDDLRFDRGGMKLIEPLGYLEFLALQGGARFVITDSGGIQEETTCLGVPCVTLRKNTERPITITQGTNILAGDDPSRVPAIVDDILAGRSKKGTIPPLWDGKAAERIADHLTGPR